jgi:hypothetical protein
VLVAKRSGQLGEADHSQSLTRQAPPAMPEVAEAHPKSRDVASRAKVGERGGGSEEGQGGGGRWQGAGKRERGGGCRRRDQSRRVGWTGKV